MKRKELIRHLESRGCALLREGKKHTIFVNRVARKSSAIPRHQEVFDGLVRKICKDLEIEPPK